MTETTEVRKLDTGTEELLCEIRERVATITLNKPHKKNALGDILTPALRETLLRLEEERDVGCVMITGAGNAFCSGGDVSGMGGGSGDAPRRSLAQRAADLTRRQETLTGRLYNLSLPTVAALPGAAAGAGFSIALACDLRVAARSAFVTTAFANIGLSGDYGASWFLPRLVGLSQARDLFFTARRVTAEEGQAMGLINRVFDDETFRDDAFEFARAIAMGPSNAFAYMKRNLNQGVEQGLAASLAMEAEHMVLSGQGGEAKEAIRAFMEKRPPKFHE